MVQAYGSDADLRIQLRKLRDLARKNGPILFIGMGGSYCSSFSGSVLLGNRTVSRPSRSMLANGCTTHKPVWNDAAVSVLLTASGESAELVALLRNSGDGPLGLICNNPSSTCWRMAAHRLPILAGPEYGNATKTYTNTAAASILLASEMLDLPWQEDTGRVIEIYDSALDRIFAGRSDLEAFCRGAANIEIVGRGAAYGAAIVSALCIREMSGFRAAAQTGAGFKHGPNLDVDSTHRCHYLRARTRSRAWIKLADECLRRGVESRARFIGRP